MSDNWRTWNGAVLDAGKRDVSGSLGELDDMEHEAKYKSATEPLDTLLDEVITTMRHASIFVRTREKMHPTGVQLYDELLAKLVAFRK